VVLEKTLESPLDSKEIQPVHSKGYGILQARALEWVAMPPSLYLGDPIFGFPGGSVGEEFACSVRDLDAILGLGGSLGEGNGYQFQYSGLKNSVNCIVHGVAKSQT